MGVRAEKNKAPNPAVGPVFPPETMSGSFQGVASVLTGPPVLSRRANLFYFKIVDAAAIDTNAPRPNVRGCPSPEVPEAYFDRIGAAMFGAGVQPPGDEQLSVPRVRQRRKHGVTRMLAEAVEQGQRKRRQRADSCERKGTVSNHAFPQEMLKGTLRKQLAGDQQADSHEVSREIMTCVSLYLFLGAVWCSCIDRQ